MTATSTIALSSFTSGLIMPVVVAVVTAALTSLGTYYSGFILYTRQRQREEIRKNYIEEGLNQCMRRTDSISHACYSNYAKLHTIMLLFRRDFGGKVVESEIVNKIFLEMQDVPMAPDYGNLKLMIFKRDNLALWVAESWSDYQRLNEYMRHHVKQEFGAYFEGENFDPKEKKAFVKKLEEQIEEYWNEIIEMHQPLYTRLLSLQVEADKTNISNIEELEKIGEIEGVKKVLDEIDVEYKKMKEAKSQRRGVDHLSS